MSKIDQTVSWLRTQQAGEACQWTASRIDSYQWRLCSEKDGLDKELVTNYIWQESIDSEQDAGQQA